MSGGGGARAIHAVVRGRVQGVGFRYSTESAARRFGLAGWVRNVADGSVEVWAQGDDAAVDALLAFLGEGPRHAGVTTVEVSVVDVDPSLRRFDVRF